MAPIFEERRWCVSHAPGQRRKVSFGIETNLKEGRMTVGNPETINFFTDKNVQANPYD